MSGDRLRLHFALDESVPDSVGRMLEGSGHAVIYLNRGEHVPRGAKDELVCAFAEINDHILVAIDNDMRRIARGFGVSQRGYHGLNLLHLRCPEPEAADRVRVAMSLIEHEWQVGAGGKRRLFLEILAGAIRTNR